MGIQAIRCALPCCTRAEEEQTKTSLITRSSVAGLGAIALLIGILILCGVPGLSALGTTGGSAITTVGGLFLLVGLCLRCVEEGGIQGAQNFTSTDPRAVGSYTFSSNITDHDDAIVHQQNDAYCSLESFLATTSPANDAIRGRLTRELAITDFTQRFGQNFGNHTVRLAVPLKYISGVRNDELLFQILKLIYLPIFDLLALPLEDIKRYDEDQIDILCLRLMLAETIIPQNAPGTLGAFLNTRDETLYQVPPTLYALFRERQVNHILLAGANIDSQLVNALFPCSEEQPFASIHSARLLSEMMYSTRVNQVLPFLNKRLLPALIQTRGNEIDYSLLTSDQVDAYLPAGRFEENETKRKLRLLHINALNQILPKLTGERLRLLSDTQLGNRELNLRALSSDQILSMFPRNMFEIENSKRRLNKLSRENREYVNTIVRL